MEEDSSRSPLAPKKRKVPYSKIRSSLKKKKRVRVESNTGSEDDDFVPEELNESLLEDSAERNNLSAFNVKSLLRRIITNQDVLSMINKRANPGDEALVDSGTIYESTLTRSKARELCRPNIAAFEEKTLETTDNETLRLLGKELPDNESSDDEYVPEDEQDESEDEDASVCASDVASTSFTVDSCSTPAAFEEESKEGAGADEFPELVIAEETSDLIAQRTRSRLPLDDTPLETLELAFIAPDITTDLYDSDCEDEEWKQFLRGFYKTNEEPVVEPEDDVDDPEYHFLEEEDVVDDLELRSDRSTKISKKELSDLIAELLEATEGNLPVTRDAEEEEELDSFINFEGTSDSSFKYINVPSSDMICEIALVVPAPLINEKCRALLDEQMRMHVQLLTQMYILSNSDSQLAEYQNNAKSLICELKCLSRKVLPDGTFSAFQGNNLEDALKIVSSTVFTQEPISNPFRRPSSKYPKTWVKPIPKSAQQIIAKSPVFMYPQLLPTRALFPPSVKQKFCFTPSEDMLMALGLEEFTPLKKEFPITKLLKTFLFPLKSERQIWVHIKNTRRLKAPERHPISYFYRHGHAPRCSVEAKAFDPQRVFPPCMQPSSSVPEWVRPYRKKEKKLVPISPAVLRPVSILPSPCFSNLNDKTEVNSPPFKTSSSRKASTSTSTPKKKYNFILPRPSPTKVHRTPTKHVHISPLKQISPILKKYGYRRVVVRGPLSFALPRSKDEKDSPRPIAPKVDQDQLKNVTKDLNSALKEQSLMPNHKDNNSSTEKTSRKKDTVPSGPTDKVDADQTSNTQLKSLPDAVHDMQKQTVQDSPEQGMVPDSVNDGGSQSELDTCEEEEEVQDNEGDLAALMTASSTICRSSLQLPKRTRQQKELESTLTLLNPDLPSEDPLKETRETALVYGFISQVKETLIDDPDSYVAFLQLLVDFNTKPVGQPAQLFRGIQKVFEKYPQLVQAFVPFLLPGQAVECGVFSQYHLQEKVLIFWQKLELYFNRQPRQLKKIRQALLNLDKSSKLTSESLSSVIQPFLRNHSHLLEEFNSLLPDHKPAEMVQSDFEDFTLPDDEDEEIKTQDSDDIFEEFVLPDTEDLYGTGQCPCVCHENSTDLRMKNRKRHCMKCGICFIDGRVFLHVGKVLKPARLIRHYKAFSPERNTKSVCLPVPTVLPVCSPPHQAQLLSPTPLPSAPPSSQSPAFCNSTVYDSDTNSQSPSKLPPGKDLKARLESGISDLLTFPSKTFQPEVIESSNNNNILIQPGESGSEELSQVDEEWRKGEDKLLLETCQKLGTTDEAFIQVQVGLTNRTLESIKSRLWELLQIFSANQKNEDDDNSEDVGT